MTDPNAWWNTLRHEGVLISPVVLDEWLPDGPTPVEERKSDRLRQAYYRFVDEPQRLRPFLDAVLEDFLGHDKSGFWRKEQNVPDRYKFQGKHANRVLLNVGKEHQPRFVVVIDDEHITDSSGRPSRLGLHSGRKRYADLLRLMRASEVKLGILTNGHHFRLVYAGLDHESWSEWSTESWFEGGDGRIALWGFYAFLGIDTLAPDARSDRNPLLEKVQESRERQADLSYVMGTQIREAVEILLEELTDSLATGGEDAKRILRPLRDLRLSREEELHALYQAAIRCIMRLVVQLYAESRGLLPKKDQLYYESYSVEGLFQLLRRAVADGREEDLRSLRSGWPRLLASWAAIYDGSTHKELQITAYGGQLFCPPTSQSRDPVLASLSILADPRVRVSDWAVYEILHKIRVGRFKIGRSKWRPGPVDFTDLRTEYIGMMYEGLLDYDLREARETDGGIVFLSIGQQPALPLVLLESLNDDDLLTLIRESETGKRYSPEQGEVDEEETESLSEHANGSPPAEPSIRDPDDMDDEDLSESQRTQDKFASRVRAWSLRAVSVTGLFGCTPTKLAKMDAPERQHALEEASHQLILKAFPPGSLYLVRWTGSRRGSGTFYTKPVLAVPIAVRSLAPLAYEDPELQLVKRPEEILAIKVCDPAMGSGSFLVAALRFLSQALRESFERYVLPRVELGERITEAGERAVGLLTERLLPLREIDASGEAMETVFKRTVVERCIYGVDINPLAVELGRLSLWIETMDPTLRFSFLDHKLKCGNSLVGAWRERTQFYPLQAWDREGGDPPGRHDSEAVLATVRNALGPADFSRYLLGFSSSRGTHRRRAGQVTPILGPLSASEVDHAPQVDGSIKQSVKKGTIEALDAARPRWDWGKLEHREIELLDSIHALASPQEQESEYVQRILNAPDHLAAKERLDAWVSVWFWPTGLLTGEGAVVPTPDLVEGRSRSERFSNEVARLAARLRFFHWELEFPEVFANGGFDCILSNPPWEQLESNEIEIFGRFDSAFGVRTDAERRRIRDQFASNSDVIAYYQNIAWSAFFLRKSWGTDGYFRGVVGPEIDTRRPQARGKMNLYREFLAQLGKLLRPKGRFGVICPSSILSDINSSGLRVFLARELGLEVVDVYVNRERFFNIPLHNKFTCLRGGTECDQVALWNQGSPVAKLSKDEAEFGWPEIEAPHSGELLAQMRAQSVGLRHYSAKVGGELNTTTDRRKGNYIEPDVRELIGIDWIPVLQGTSIERYNGFAKSFEFEQARWRPRSFGEEALSNRYLNPDVGNDLLFKKFKIAFKLTSKPQINPRSAIGAVMPICSTVHTLGVIWSELAEEIPLVAAIFNSYAFDYFLRYYIQGQSITKELIAQVPWPKIPENAVQRVSELVMRLSCPADHPSVRYPPEYHGGDPPLPPGQREVAEEELDGIVATAYGLGRDEMRWILRPDNPDPRGLWHDYQDRLSVLESAGFRGKWYTLDEARNLRTQAGLEVHF